MKASVTVKAGADGFYRLASLLIDNPAQELVITVGGIDAAYQFGIYVQSRGLAPGFCGRMAGLRFSFGLDIAADELVLAPFTEIPEGP